MVDSARDMSVAEVRRLTLLRHAQAHPARAGQHDFERPLDAAGLLQLRTAAPAFARATREHPVDRCLFSPAVRTAATAAAFTGALELPKESAVATASLYEIEPNDLLALLRDTPQDVRHLLVVGHNPGLSLVAARLSPELRSGLSPCAHVTVSFTGEWRELR